MNDISRVEFDSLRGDVTEIKDDVKSLRRALYGSNGDSDKSIISRLLSLEFRLNSMIGNVPTWQWLIERFGVPVVTAIIVAAVMYFIYGAP